MSDTTDRFRRSTGAATFSQVWRVGVTFGVMLLLKRLIPRDDHGLFDWALSVYLILGAVRDLGLVYHIVRVPSRPYGNLLFVQLTWGVMLAAASFVGADVIARGMEEPHPQVVPVVAALSLFLLFEGLSSVPRVYFDAELQVGRTVVPEIARNLVFAGTSLSMAWLGYGVWALVAGQVLSVLVYALLLWQRAWGRIPLRWERGNTWDLVRHSLPLATIWFLAIFVQRVDTLILGRRFSSEVIGEYFFAYSMAVLVTITIVPAITRTLYPALVAYRSEPAKMAEAYRLATLLVLALEAPVAAFLLVNPETSILILGGEQWLMAPAFLQVLALAPLMDPFSRLGGEMLKVFHMDRVWIFSAALTLLSFVVFGWTFTGIWGPMGMAWANYLPLGGLVMAWAIYRIAPGPFRQLLADVVVLYLAPVAPFALAWWLGGDRLWVRFALSLVAMASVFALYLWRFGAAFKSFFRKPAPAG
jgi:O-antigen/teichoic acid export membrane protein